MRPKLPEIVGGLQEVNYKSSLDLLYELRPS